MTTKDEVARRKLSLLELAKELDNVSRACKTLKGVGKVYLQTAIDCHSRYGWARLYPNKMPVVTAGVKLPKSAEVIFPTVLSPEPGL